MNKLYSVKTNGKATVYANLSKYEQKLFDFIKNESSTVGKSISSKNFIQKFSEWNDDKASVKASTIASASTLKKVCKAIASCVSSGTLELNALPTVHANRQHGTYSVDFVGVDKLDAEYKNNELKIKEKKEVNAMEFLSSYIEKHAKELDKQILLDIVNSLV